MVIPILTHLQHFTFTLLWSYLHTYIDIYSNNLFFLHKCPSFLLNRYDRTLTLSNTRGKISVRFNTGGEGSC